MKPQRLLYGISGLLEQTSNRRPSKLGRRPSVLTAIRQAAECRGIAADLTGTPGPWRGPKWQSQLLLWVLLILAYLLLASLFSVMGFHCRGAGGRGGA